MHPSDATDAKNASQVGSFLVAAVGSSAGGLEAAAALLRELGPAPTIAVVILHRFKLTDESGSVDILTRATEMPVVAVAHGDRIEPNRVYVVPPHADLLIHDGVFQLVPERDEESGHWPIDRFFESLAIDCNDEAVGVVLSGDGFDAAEGVKAIKREGGIVMAQDGTAQHPSMPRSAIATGCVDYVLPPAALAHELLRLGAPDDAPYPEPSARARAEPGARIDASISRVGHWPARGKQRRAPETNDELRKLNGELKERNAEATRKSDDLTNVLTSAEIPMLIVDRDLRLRRFTPAAGKVFGLRATDLGVPIGAIRRIAALSPSLMPCIAHVIDDLAPVDCLVQDEGGYRFEVSLRPYVTVDGGVHGTVISARDVDDESRGAVLLAFRDVTEAERTRIARADLSFRDALTGAAEAIVMVDAAGWILYANPAAAKIFGFRVEELPGLSVDVLLPEGLREIHARHRARYLASPSARPMGPGRDLVGRRKDGSEFPIEVALSTMARDDGPVVVAFVTDVTQRRAAERQITLYQDRLRRMAFDAVLTEQRERRRIAIGLHDRIGQALALAQIELTSARRDLEGRPRAAVERAVDLLDEAIAEQRTLIFDLSPPVLYDLGLKEALAWLAEDIEKRHGFALPSSTTERTSLWTMPRRRSYFARFVSSS